MNKKIYKLSVVVIIIMCIIAILTACSSPAPIFEEDKKYTYKATPDDKDNFSFAQFTMWCPKNIKAYRGILYLGAGYEYSSTPMIYEKKWQDFARENEFVILTSHMKSRTEANSEIAYWQAEYGSGEEMLNALGYLALEAKHPEIENAPLAMWGFSAGGQYNYHFTCWKPERVITFVAIKGGYYFSELNNETLKVPGLFFTGENDLQRRKDAVEDLFDKYAKDEPLWCLANEAASGHEIGKTDELAISWLQEIINQRLPKKVNTAKKPIKLGEVNQSQAWLGDRTGGYIAPISDYKNDKKSASWLPNESLAKAWELFHLHQ
jgi:predicted esterase